jgi:hypothetical protein
LPVVTITNALGRLILSANGKGCVVGRLCHVPRDGQPRFIS